MGLNGTSIIKIVFAFSFLSSISIFAQDAVAEGANSG
jgi:hypothetical protein